MELNRYYAELLDQPAVKTAAGRRMLTENDPLLFAMLYLRKHMVGPDGSMSLSLFHQDLIRYGTSWINELDEPMKYRDCFIAPRESGKSTWLFLLLPMWAAAHGHVQFIAAYSSTAKQAEGHLRTFKRELEQNTLLRTDFPLLCDVERVESKNRSVVDNNFMTARANGFVFFANGVDNSNHGLKYGNLRPQLIILDDIEPGEANYTLYQRDQRRSTLFDDIAPQNIFARMVVVGTTTMPDSLIDQMRKYGELTGLQSYSAIKDYIHPDNDRIPDELRWIKDQNIKVHYYPAILTDDEGNESSLWAEKWSLPWLQSRKGQRDFAKNYMNRPISMSSQYWGLGDIDTKEPVVIGNTLIAIDPAVTTARRSDYTGIAVIARGTDEDGREAVYVLHAEQLKAGPQAIAERVSKLVDEYNAGVLYVETNQGGDLWRDVFKDINVTYRAMRNSDKKEIRAGKVLNLYQRALVYHAKDMPVLVEQLMGFPNISHDDVIDAVCSGVLYFLEKPKQAVATVQVKYQ